MGVTEDLPLSRIPAHYSLEKAPFSLQGSSPQWDLSQSRFWWLHGDKGSFPGGHTGLCSLLTEMIFLLPSGRAVLCTASLSHRKTIFQDPEVLFPLLGKKKSELGNPLLVDFLLFLKWKQHFQSEINWK